MRSRSLDEEAAYAALLRELAAQVLQFLEAGDGDVDDRPVPVLIQAVDHQAETPARVARWSSKASAAM